MLEPKQIVFPQYRKYSNDRTFFKINSEKDFEELVIIGSYYSFTSMTIKIYPDRLLIKDMLENRDNRWVTISEEEFNYALERCRKNLKLIKV